MFEDDASHPARHAAGTRRARTPGPGAVGAPTAPGPISAGTASSASGTAQLVDAGCTPLEQELADLLAVHVGAAHPYTALELDAAHVGADCTSRDQASSDPALDALLGDAPGPSLAAALAGTEPADLDDASLIELLAAWERLAAWAQAGSAAALGELLLRTRGSSRHQFVVDEVSARLGLSRHAAAQRVGVAHGAQSIPEVADAMAAGVADRRKAEALVSTGRLDDVHRREVVRELRPDLEHLTVRQIRDRLRRAEIVVDPEGARERHARARRTRSVVLEPVDDAMAYLTAYLPADDAVRAWVAIDDLGAATRRTPGEARRLDECRADALVALLTGAVEQAAAAGGGSPDEAPHTEGPPVRASRTQASPVQVTIAASTLLGTDDLPAILAGYGPIPAPMARTIATDAEATWQRILTDPVTGVLTDRSSRSYRPSPRLRATVLARDATCTFPGCSVPASRGDLDHIAAFDPGRDGPQTHGDNLHALCRAHHRAKTTGGWSVVRDPESGVTTWTSPTEHRYFRPPYRADPARPPGRPRRRAPIDEGPPPF
ncbi:HNH endonuclease signature motif containing protein [Isoptericola croceus]|uniref:HNH endonuclease signature motif containing protein n=1 Tax=Isoptericola croceus TaxID=3031406 RepID=UPI0023F92E51|nr:HNH endonuclease signature motif containing protein [Isoptericola croceus]